MTNKTLCLKLNCIMGRITSFFPSYNFQTFYWPSRKTVGTLEPSTRGGLMKIILHLPTFKRILLSTHQR
ncbi:hypothetical protein BpHYR1_004346 [Brachionus plicatilis]|uniref:Uncharacterized protein n=1 Tax=Brachionus plicatilis TaxID=10195 RepID=A0A3M7RFF0_BRAPC|nr:hypothetical protein BpHYR1_004346 [Brachionus plicatilis]